MIFAAALLLLVSGDCDDQLKSAAVALQQNDVRAAESLLQSARPVCQESAWFYELVGIARGRSGDQIASEEAFARAVSLSPTSVRLLVGLASTYLTNQKVAEAARTFGKAAALDPSDPRILFSAGTLSAQIGDYNKASEYLRQIPESAADEAVYFNLGLAYSHLKQIETARRYFFKAVDRHAGYAEAYFRVGLDYAESGNPRRAVPWLFRAKDLLGNRVDVDYALTEALLRLRYRTTAKEVVTGSLESNPDNASLMVAAGDVAQQEQRWEEAKARYQQALQGQPRLVPALIGMAQVLVEQGNEEEANRLLQTALLAEPANPIANGEIGKIQLHRNDLKGAISHLQVAYQQDHANLAVGLELARALRTSDQQSEALQILKTLLPANKDSVPLHLGLAQTYAKLNRPAEARAEQETAASLDTQAHDALRFESVQTYVH